MSFSKKFKRHHAYCVVGAGPAGMRNDFDILDTMLTKNRKRVTRFTCSQSHIDFAIKSEFVDIALYMMVYERPKIFSKIN